MRITPGWLAALSLTAVACQETPPPAPRAQPAARQEHYVSPPQLARAGALTDRRIAPFTAQTADGAALDWDTLLGLQPVVVIFIKKDCPCSAEFEPFFHRLERAYRDSVRFVGVIDGDTTAARAFTTANRSPYPVLADPELQIIRRFEAEHGSYVALVRSDGTLGALWPGLSVAMMRELSAQLAMLAQVPVQTIDEANMPKALMTGCPYIKE